jgi:hypothetical protein
VTATLAGCAATSGDEVQVASPDLVAVQPGVQVVADADAPLFFADGYYWLYRHGVWLRSETYRGGFAQVDINLVPMQVRSIRRPSAYVHYREHANVDGKPEPRAENAARPKQNTPPPAPISTRETQPNRSWTPPQPPPRAGEPIEQKPPIANPIPEQQVPPTPRDQGSAEPDRSDPPDNQ